MFTHITKSYVKLGYVGSEFVTDLFDKEISFCLPMTHDYQLSLWKQSVSLIKLYTVLITTRLYPRTHPICTQPLVIDFENLIYNVYIQYRVTGPNYLICNMLKIFNKWRYCQKIVGVEKYLPSPSSQKKNFVLHQSIPTVATRIRNSGGRGRGAFNVLHIYKQFWFTFWVHAMF